MNRRALSRKIRDWAGLSGRQQLFDKTGKEWIFRGQNGGWPLSSSLERATSDFNLDQAKLLPNLEIKLLLEFIRHYHLYASEAPPRHGDTLDWLALMRHHGAPTRLLDFTFSFQVAAYFALEEKSKGDPIVYAVNKTWLSKLGKAWARKCGKELDSEFSQLGRFRDGAAFRKLFLRAEPELVLAISPFRRTQRLAVQQGIFLCPGNVKHRFSQILRKQKDWHENVIEITILAQKRNELLGLLDRAGLNRASLFPGLDGFAQSLRTRMLLLSRLQRMERTKARMEPNIGVDTLDQW
jgi:FRG domain